MDLKKHRYNRKMACQAFRLFLGAKTGQGRKFYAASYMFYSFYALKALR